MTLTLHWREKESALFQMSQMALVLLKFGQKWIWIRIEIRISKLKQLTFSQQYTVDTIFFVKTESVSKIYFQE